MSQELRPLRECLESLRELVRKGASGSLYLADAGDNIAVVVINQGAVDAVNFQGRRGDFAVELLKSVPAASISFHPEVPRSAKNFQLSASATRWLTDGAAAPSARPAAVTPAPRPPEAAEKSEVAKHRRSIEAVAFSYLGPIAGALCDAVFSDHSDLPQVIDALAANLPANEAAQFRSDVAKATAAS